MWFKRYIVTYSLDKLFISLLAVFYFVALVVLYPPCISVNPLEWKVHVILEKKKENKSRKVCLAEEFAFCFRDQIIGLYYMKMEGLSSQYHNKIVVQG